jgi:amidohydrolase
MRSAAIVMIVVSAVSASSPAADRSAAAGAYLDRTLGDLVAFYKDLHAHPELSLREERSSGRIAERLEKAGYAVTRGVGGHGVVGVLINGRGPTVLVRGDMDALPIVEETGLDYKSDVTQTGSDGRSVGVMHACGHDVHQTCLVGTAALLAEMRDHWRGTLVIIAQPAEEIGAGAAAMIADGLFKRFPKPDYCLALHVSANLPAGMIGYTPGWALANVDSVDVTIFGRGGHGSRPHEAIDPIVIAAEVTVALQTIVSRRLDPIEPGVITVGSLHAGSKHNIIPDEAHMQLTVRSYTDEARKLLLDGIREVTINTARALGCEKDPLVHVRTDEFTPATYNDPDLSAAAAKVLARVVGGENVIVVKAQMGGEDFGRYPKALGVPGFIFWLGSVNKDVFIASRKPGGSPLPSIHSSKFAPDPNPTIKVGVKCMSEIVLSLLADADGQ